MYSNVVSENNPHGVLSNVSCYPVAFDSQNYKVITANPNSDESIALLTAQAKYTNEIVKLTTSDNANRVGWAVSRT